MVDKIVKQEKEETKQKKWQVGQITVTTKDVIANSETGVGYSIEEALVLILNKLDETL